MALDVADGIEVVGPTNATFDHRCAVVAHGHGRSDDPLTEESIQVTAAGTLVGGGRKCGRESHGRIHLSV